MKPRTIIFDGEPVEISRYRSTYDSLPMYRIRLMNFLDFYGTYSTSARCDLREELAASLSQRRGVVANMRWIEEHNDRVYAELCASRELKKDTHV